MERRVCSYDMVKIDNSDCLGIYISSVSLTALSALQTCVRPLHLPSHSICNSESRFYS